MRNSAGRRGLGPETTHSKHAIRARKRENTVEQSYSRTQGQRLQHGIPRLPANCTTRACSPSAWWDALRPSGLEGAPDVSHAGCAFTRMVVTLRLFHKHRTGGCPLLSRKRLGQTERLSVPGSVPSGGGFQLHNGSLKLHFLSLQRCSSESQSACVGGRGRSGWGPAGHNATCVSAFLCLWFPSCKMVDIVVRFSGQSRQTVGAQSDRVVAVTRQSTAVSKGAQVMPVVSVRAEDH